jgi:hypothetical protein
MVTCDVMETDIRNKKSKRVRDIRAMLPLIPLSETIRRVTLAFPVRNVAVMRLDGRDAM